MRSQLDKHKTVAIITAGIVGIIFTLWALLFGLYLDMTWRQWKWLTRVFLERGFFPGGLNPLHFTTWTWLIISVVAGCATFFKFNTGRVRALGIGGTAVCACVAIYVFAIGINNHSGGYAGNTTFIVENPKDLPSSLKRLGDDTTGSTKGCTLYAYNDMRGCINTGTFNFEWDNRGSSATGARTVIERSGGSVSNTKLLNSMPTYVYGATKDAKSVWTSIRDGKNRQPVYGVQSYSGEGDVTTCRFKGQYAMNKAFSGKWGRNLSDEIAGKYPNLFYDGSDRYGYCDGDKPVIIIPVKKQVTFKTRTSFRSAGVLVITGSPSGQAQYEHVQDVKPGDFPGPVYPASLAKEQREAMGMIAGIWDSISGKFGYEPTNAESQQENPSEYQLRDKAGRVYWVTPMKPRSSDSQLLAAYSIIPADTASGGSLNEQRIFVLPDNDPRAVNVDDMEARIKQTLSAVDPGFYSAGGKLVEFLPLSGKEWQVYGELSGRVVYRVVVPTDSRVKTVVFDLDETAAEPTAPGTPTKASACVENLKSLRDKDLAQCLSDLSSELQSRQKK